MKKQGHDELYTYIYKYVNKIALKNCLLKIIKSNQVYPLILTYRCTCDPVLVLVLGAAPLAAPALLDGVEVALEAVVGLGGGCDVLTLSLGYP